MGQQQTENSVSALSPLSLSLATSPCLPAPATNTQFSLTHYFISAALRPNKYSPRVSRRTCAGSCCSTLLLLFLSFLRLLSMPTFCSDPSIIHSRFHPSLLSTVLLLLSSAGARVHANPHRLYSAWRGMNREREREDRGGALNGRERERRQR